MEGALCARSSLRHWLANSSRRHNQRGSDPLPLLVRKEPDWHRRSSQFSGEVGILGGVAKIDQIRPGDTIIVWKLDRLARSTRDLLNTMETINDTRGKFQSLSEPWANTTTHAGKMIMTVFAGIAEFERDLIRERTSAGRDAARQRGPHARIRA